MVQNNKVLTVSYGTFSCTLEGFEDSFGTMKAIAEYFRDLASDDRYFGAEPPQPDAEMLARIAQREVARQVEARTSSEGIHLRAATPELQADGAAAVPLAQSSKEETQAPIQSAAEVAYDAQEPSAAEISEPPNSAPTASAPSAAKTTVDEVPPFEDSLSEIDFFDEEDEVEDEPQNIAPAEADAGDLLEEVAAQDNTKTEQAGGTTVDMDTIAAISAAVAQAPATSPENAVEIEEEPSAGVAEFLEDFEDEIEEAGEAVAEIIEEQPQAPARDADTVPAIDSIAAKLQRIRAVVAQAPAENEFSEDQHAESISGTGAALIDEAELAEDDLEAAEDALVEDDEISRALNRLDLKVSQAEATTETAAPTGETAPESASPQEPEAPQSVAAQESAQPKGKPKARIIRMKRADLEKAVAQGTLRQAVSKETQVPSQNKVTAAESESIFANSSLDDEDEADLLRELAEVEAELLASNKPVETEAREASLDNLAETEATEASAHPEPAQDQAQTDRPAQVQSSPDSDVSRLMEAAESKLGDPEGASQRETYKQLRAAVAAETADRSATGNKPAADESEPYREDLANVVRPRRPAGGKAVRAARPRSEASRPAPLKLVAEQRVDAAQQTQAKPIRPRRVSLQEDELANGREEDGGFKQYASDCGAVDLGELLEAAAAYLSFVEGRNDFSRPQLMNKVRSAGSMQFNREDGLRSFGQLLREGKIERADNGRFAATEEIGFQPGKRAAG